MRKYHSEYWKASEREGSWTLSRGGLLFVVERRKARSDLLKRPGSPGTPGGSFSMSGASKAMMSMVVPSTDSWVPFTRARGAQSAKTPRWLSTGRDSSTAARE